MYQSLGSHIPLRSNSMLLQREAHSASFGNQMNPYGMNVGPRRGGTRSFGERDAGCPSLRIFHQPQRARPYQQSLAGDDAQQRWALRDQGLPAGSAFERQPVGYQSQAGAMAYEHQLALADATGITDRAGGIDRVSEPPPPARLQPAQNDWGPVLSMGMPRSPAFKEGAPPVASAADYEAATFDSLKKRAEIRKKPSAPSAKPESHIDVTDDGSDDEAHCAPGEDEAASDADDASPSCVAKLRRPVAAPPVAKPMLRRPASTLYKASAATKKAMELRLLNAVKLDKSSMNGTTRHKLSSNAYHGAYTACTKAGLDKADAKEIGRKCFKKLTRLWDSRMTS